MAAEKHNSNYHISSLLRKLQNSSSSTVQKALISLSRATRKSDNVVKLREEGGIQLLLTFIQSSNKKSLDMAVSTLANCAMDGKCRAKIKQLNGVSLLCNILASLADISILTRVTRALANLSVDVSVTNEIVSLKAFPKLLDILEWSTDAHLLQNTLRALRIMAKSYSCMKELGESNGILHFVELLGKENSNETKRCCLQTLLELSKVGNGVLATQFQEHGAIKVVSQLSYSDDKDVTEHCIHILCTLTKYCQVRVSVGTVGGVEAFINQIQNRSLLLRPSIEGACMCCREAVNRNKIRSCGGLEVVLDVLRCPEYADVFDNILGAFACFIYDDIALKLLIAWGLIPILVSMLQKQLFPENTAKNVVGKQDNDLSKSSDKMTATATHKKNVKPTSAHPIPSATAPSSSPRSDPQSLPKTFTIPPLYHASYPTFPSPGVSPNLSPELRVPFMAPGSPESPRSSSLMVYSPSGSEVDESSSSDSDVVPAQDAGEDSGPSAEISQPKSDKLVTPAFNEGTLSEDCTGKAEEETKEDTSHHKNLTAAQENVLSTMMEDFAKTCFTNRDLTAEKMFVMFDETGRPFWFHQQRQNEENLFPQQVSRRQARGPLLPWASINEHRRQFLMNENLFSADQPSPRKVQHDMWSRQKSWRSYGAAHASSSTSLGTSRPSSSSPQSSSPSSHLEGIESKIIFLLSRFGQMPDVFEDLTSPECIQTLLDYFCYSKKPDARCERLFSRMAWDCKYFETFVVTMFPGAVYRQLICGLRPGYLLSNQSNSSHSSESSVQSAPEPANAHVNDPAEIDSARLIPAEVVPGKVDPGEVDPREVESAEVNPAEVLLTEVVPGEVVHAEVDPGDIKPEKAESAEVNLAEVLPAEVVPGEVVNAEVDPGDIKPEKAKSAEVNPAEALPAEVVRGEVDPREVDPRDVDPGKVNREKAMPAEDSPSPCGSSTVVEADSLNPNSPERLNESSTCTQEPITTNSLASVNHPTEVMPLACGSSIVVETNSANTESQEFSPKDNPTCHSNTESNNPEHQSISDNKVSTSDATQTSSTKESVDFLKHIKQAGTSFGTGILTHLLLRGTPRQVEACALSLPYICKSLLMKQKLLINHQGLMVILSLLCTSTVQADIVRAVNSITYLIANSALKMDKDIKVFIAKNESQFLVLHSRANDVFGPYRLITYQPERSWKTRASSKDNVTAIGSSSEGRTTVESSSTTAAGDSRNAARTIPEAYWRGKRDITRRMYEVDRHTSRMSNVQDDGFSGGSDSSLGPRGFSSRRDLPFQSSMGEDDCRSSVKSKRLGEVDGNFAPKRTKMGACGDEQETPFTVCLHKRTHPTPFDVVVKVGSGESIEAHRSVLRDLSEVFAAMLSSNFIEGRQSEINLKDLNHATLLFLVHYAYGCCWSFQPDAYIRSLVCPFLEKCLSGESSPCVDGDSFIFDFDFLLDLLSCSDRFLLSDLKKQCEQLMMHSLSVEHVEDAYLAAVLYNTSRLRVHCLQYIFLGNLELKSVCQCVVNLLQSEERDKVIEDFRNIALDCCKEGDSKIVDGR